MSNPFDGSATLKFLTAVQTSEPDVTSGLGTRSADSVPIGKAPDLVGRYNSYHKTLRHQNKELDPSSRQYKINLAMMTAIGSLITLELDQVYPLSEGKHVIHEGEIFHKPPK